MLNDIIWCSEHDDLKIVIKNAKEFINFQKINKIRGYLKKIDRKYIYIIKKAA